MGRKAKDKSEKLSMKFKVEDIWDFDREKVGDFLGELEYRV